ncbi:MAG: hypothetical protein ACXWEM_06065 [Halobacteriota archaeon]
MNTYEASYYPTGQGEQYKRRAFQADLLKLTVAVVAELVIFLLWFDGPARERYEILVHVALPICIVLPIINYRYLIVVPFIAFLPDVARAFDIDISHSLAILPLVFVAGFVPFIRRPKTALIAAYAATAVCASHLIIDARKYAIVESFSGYPWSDLVLYTFLLTVVGFLLMQVLRLGDNHSNRDSYGLRDSSLSNATPLSGEAPAVYHTDDTISNRNSKPQRSRRIEVTTPEGTAEVSRVNKAKDSSSSTDHKLQFDSYGFVVGDVTSKKALRSKIRGKKGS